jgi:hypothetical protein
MPLETHASRNTEDERVRHAFRRRLPEPFGDRLSHLEVRGGQSCPKEAVMRGAVTLAMLAILLLSIFAAGQEGREASGGGGQLRSFAAIRSLDLAPPLPGTEAVYSEVAELLKTHDETYVRQQVQLNRSSWYIQGWTPDWGPTPPRARCTLRADLPKPRYLGLECRDADGQYIGTLRAKSGRALLSELESLCFGLHSRGSTWIEQGAVAVPGTLPLHEYRYIYVIPFHWPGYREHAEYLAELLGAAGSWRVVSSTDSAPPEDTQRMLQCWFRTWAGSEGGAGSHMGRATLYLADAGRRPVREITGVSEWFGPRKGAIRAAVGRLAEARSLDEEIHRPLAEAPRR